MDSEVTLRKQWFIKAKTGNIEDFYEIDNKKVIDFFYTAAGHWSIWDGAEGTN